MSFHYLSVSLWLNISNQNFISSTGFPWEGSSNLQSGFIGWSVMPMWPESGIWPTVYAQIHSPLPVHVAQVSHVRGQGEVGRAHLVPMAGMVFHGLSHQTQLVQSWLQHFLSVWPWSINYSPRDSVFSVKWRKPCLTCKNAERIGNEYAKWVLRCLVAVDWRKIF